MSNRYGSGPLTCKVYIGGLSRNASREEIEDAFGRYGKLDNVFVARNPPGFAFVEFTDPQDAEDSVRALDGRFFDFLPKWLPVAFYVYSLFFCFCFQNDLRQSCQSWAVTWQDEEWSRRGLQRRRQTRGSLETKIKVYI